MCQEAIRTMFVFDFALLYFTIFVCVGVEDILVKPGANKWRKMVIKESLKMGTKVSSLVG